MKRLLAGALAAGALMLPAIAHAQEPAPAPGPVPPDVKVRVGAHSYPRPWGLTYVYGYVRRPVTVPNAYVENRPVVLEQSVWPFKAWTPVGTGQTGYLGYFSFRFPGILTNTMYRATVTFDQQPLPSQDLLLHVPYRPTLSLRVRKGKAGSVLVTARGIVRPGHPGVHAWLQRQAQNGFWRNFKRVTLTGAGSFSTFKTRPFRIKQHATFRLRLASDTQNADAISRVRGVK